MGQVRHGSATTKSKTCVWRWQERFMAAGAGGLLREKTRPPGTPKTSDGEVGEVIRLTLDPPPHEATHWTTRAMRKAVGGLPPRWGKSGQPMGLHRIAGVSSSGPMPGLYRETARCRWALRRATRSRGSAVGR